MRKIVVLSLLFVLILMGCGNEAYHNAIQKGLDYIASEEYQKAESAFELALDEKKNDDKAATLLAQTKNYQEAQEALGNGEMDVAVKLAEKVSEVKEGSNALVKKAEGILSSIKDLQTKLDEFTEKHTKAIQQFESKEYDGANETLDELLKSDLTHSVFQSVKADIENLQEDVKTAIVAQKTAEEEASKVKKKAELKKAGEEKKKKAQKVANETEEQVKSRIAKENEDRVVTKYGWMGAPPSGVYDENLEMIKEYCLNGGDMMDGFTLTCYDLDNGDSGYLEDYSDYFFDGGKNSRYSELVTINQIYN